MGIIAPNHPSPVDSFAYKYNYPCHLSLLWFVGFRVNREWFDPRFDPVLVPKVDTILADGFTAQGRNAPRVRREQFLADEAW